MIDDLGSWPPVMHLSSEERVEHDRAEVQFRQLHPDYQSHRWSMQESRVSHCGLCCPLLTLSQGQIENISRILSGHVRREE
ncbi:hypothetical protein BHD05_05355 [Marisediminicola antarctica]|uniref:Uncharacterized protein n=1 Tax=Marisediminicola antarctica TaxID=674079 RepID=A0A7L5AGP6_9MICO|nr:hypothetical protein BHD05_05355 [Marisediminicola antarctica]